LKGKKSPWRVEDFKFWAGGFSFYGWRKLKGGRGVTSLDRKEAAPPRCIILDKVSYKVLAWTNTIEFQLIIVHLGLRQLLLFWSFDILSLLQL
jgi:hypothetical protein